MMTQCEDTLSRLEYFTQLDGRVGLFQVFCVRVSCVSVQFELERGFRGARIRKLFSSEVWLS